MMETNLEEVEGKVRTSEIVCNGEVGNCRCCELEERSRKAEARCVELELEAQKRKSEYEALETKFRTLEAVKLALENEIKVLKSQNHEFCHLIGHSDNENLVGNGGKGVMEGVVDLTEENDEEDKVFKLMTENRVLECEKSEAEVWKQKFKELESLTLLLRKSLVLKSAEQPFDGKKSDGNCDIVACGNKTSEAIESKDGSHVENSLNDMTAIVKAVGFMDSGSTLISPGKGAGNLQPAGTPFSDTPCKHFTSDEGDYSRLQNGKQVKRHLAFQEERSPSKQMAPSTPNGAKTASVSIIDIHDSDDEPDLAPSTNKQEYSKGNISNNNELDGTVGSENQNMTIGGQKLEEQVGSCEDNVPFISVSKRKRALNIVTSDTENDDDDNVPIGRLRRMRCEEVVSDQTSIKAKGCAVADIPPGIDNVGSTVTPRKRRLVSLRQSERKTGVKNYSSKKTSENECSKGITKTEDIEDDSSEAIGSDGESDSLNGFIVDDSAIADGDNGCSESQGGSDCNNAHSGSEDVSSGSSACSGSKDVSDDEVDFDVILSQLKRNKDRKSDWKFEGELLAAFGKDLELCMKAVCALYRQQTSGEKLWKATLLQNQRGFSKFDAHRGCTLAEFLTDGDPQGDLKKSVRELQAYDSNAVELCRDLATRYSKQLFQIYNSKEDPYFRPSDCPATN
ncbi:PREDICTED: protein IWS1 homolog A [Theobroma cacao]|uniref:Protein IWS1 homolog A n=1 Tax=Theobroma cacao TaxID=3641 RepID=A0AB32VDG7_THECC|nr:PREDICTED: protein IWS1 homolog A [Theobroma cacao]